MTDPAITCPHCRGEIKLTESLAAPLVDATRQEFQRRLSQKNSEMAELEKVIREQESAMTRERESLNQRLAEMLRAERPKIAAEETRRAHDALALDLAQKSAELAALQKALAQYSEKLVEAQKAQVDLIRQKRELDDARRELELSVEKQVQEGLAKARETARREAEERLSLKVMEKEQTIQAMQRQIEDLQRRAQQSSQQLQGEVLELRLESLLREKFPIDLIRPVPKGEYGGDVLQYVNGPNGKRCGTILWESKRTKSWQDQWLPKLRDDQRSAKADIAVLVTQALPKNVETFDFTDGIWVTDLRCLVPVALALRLLLIEVACARQSLEGQQTKMDQVYQYLTGPRFRQRVQAIVEKFTDMHADLDKERKTLTRLWAKREEQIRSVLDTTAGLYGDLQGIAGQSLQELDGLDIKLLDTPPS
jgi:hypothetical protein